MAHLKQSLLVNCLRERPFLFAKPAVSCWKARSCRQLEGWTVRGSRRSELWLAGLRPQEGRLVGWEELLLALACPGLLLPSSFT